MPLSTIVNFLSNSSNSIFHPNLPIFINVLTQHKATNESVQQPFLLATTSTDIALTTALSNFDSNRQVKSSILGTDEPLLDTTFDLALTNLTAILSLYIVLA